MNNDALTDEQIDACWRETITAKDCATPNARRFARAIEKVVRAALAAPVVPDTQAQELQRLRSLLTEARGHLQGRKMSMLAMSQTRLLQAIDHALQPKEHKHVD